MCRLGACACSPRRFGGDALADFLAAHARTWSGSTGHRGWRTRVISLSVGKSTIGQEVARLAAGRSSISIGRSSVATVRSIRARRSWRIEEELAAEVTGSSTWPSVRIPLLSERTRELLRSCALNGPTVADDADHFERADASSFQWDHRSAPSTTANAQLRAANSTRISTRPRGNRSGRNRGSRPSYPRADPRLRRSRRLPPVHGAVPGSRHTHPDVRESRILPRAASARPETAGATRRLDNAWSPS